MKAWAIVDEQGQVIISDNRVQVFVTEEEARLTSCHRFPQPAVARVSVEIANYHTEFVPEGYGMED
jgi:hypothetical protein